MSYIIKFINYSNKHWEVWPIVIMTAGIMALSVITPVSHLWTRKDIEFYRNQKRQHHISWLENPKVSKLKIVHADTWLPDLEMAQVYRDMEKKEKELKQKNC